MRLVSQKKTLLDFFTATKEYSSEMAAVMCKPQEKEALFDAFSIEASDTLSESVSVYKRASTFTATSFSGAVSAKGLALKRSMSLFAQDDEFLQLQDTAPKNVDFTLNLLTPASSPFSTCVYDFEHNGEKCQLPFVETGKDALKRISCETLTALIQGQYDANYDEKYVIDCRFPYEYEGGHIQSAINVNTMEQLEELFLRRAAAKPNRRTVIVFHCEFSSHRAPRMALHLRKRDRAMNMANYPALTFPEIYILRGGYKAFYTEEKSLCEPANYVEMHHDDYRHELRKEMSNFKKSWKRSRSFSHHMRQVVQEEAGEAED
jgi:M-phase inducer tyrosine phosphatase